MAVTDKAFEDLRERVRDIDAVLRALKIAAGVLGITGAVLITGLLIAGKQIRDASREASQAKDLATTAAKDISEKKRELDEISRAAQKSIATAETEARTRIQSYFAAAIVTDEQSWTKGMPPVRLGVRRDQGVCFLTWVEGGFNGHGERVNIDVRDDEYVLSGVSTAAVSARARCIKFRPLS